MKINKIASLIKTERLFNELGRTRRESVILDSEESRRFWSDILAQVVKTQKTQIG